MNLIETENNTHLRVDKTTPNDPLDLIEEIITEVQPIKITNPTYMTQISLLTIHRYLTHSKIAKAAQNIQLE